MVISGPNVRGDIFIPQFCLTLCCSSLVIHTHLLLTYDAVYTMGEEQAVGAVKLDKDGLSLTSIWQFENSVFTFSTTFRPAQRMMLNLSMLVAWMALAGRALFHFDTKSPGIIKHVEHSISISAHTSLTNLCPKLQVAMDASRIHFERYPPSL